MVQNNKIKDAEDKVKDGGICLWVGHFDAYFLLRAEPDIIPYLNGYEVVGSDAQA